MRLLLLIVGVAIIYILLKNYFRNLQQPGPAPRPQRPENMVPCAQCGVNVPQTEAIFSRGEFFCTDEHRRLRQQ